MAYGNPYEYESNSGFVPDKDGAQRDRGYGVTPPKKQTTAGTPSTGSYYNADGSKTYTYGAPTAAPAPAAPPPPGPGTMGADRPIDPSMGGIGKYIAGMMANPDPYERDIYKADYAQGIRNIDDSYNQQKTGIDEEMARRGIHDSTIAGGRLHDLNIGRRGAAVELQDRLAQNRARDYMGNALQVGQMGLGWGNQGLSQFNSQNDFLLALLSALGQGDFVGG